MKIFIWQRIEELTENWHPEGGVAIVASSIDRAKKMVQGISPNKNQEIPNPDFEAAINQEEEKIWIFPDAGCC